MNTAVVADLYYPGMTPEHLDRRAVRRSSNLPHDARGFEREPPRGIIDTS